MGKKILIIEDDPLIVKIYKTRLTSDGYEVHAKDNGVDGLALADSVIPDLVILDVMMPKMDGFDVLSSIRKNEKIKHVPVIMYSNLGAEAEMKRALSLGANEFVVKANMSPTEFVDKIKKILT